MHEQRCNVICRPNVFDADSAVYAQAKAGQTIEQLLGAGATYAADVTINGELVPRELWARVKPKAGTQIHVTLFPQGGSGRKWLRAILMIIVLVVAVIFQQYELIPGILTWGTVIGVVGMIAINALIPPPTPKGLGNGSGDPFQQLNKITGTSNNASPYGVIPCVVGMYRFFPCHAALPYTEISGNDQYLRMLLDLGYGDLDISDIKIGATDIASYDGVEYEITPTPTLFTQDIYELSVGTSLANYGDTDTRTTQAASTEISLDIVFPSGLFGINDKGNTTTGNVDFAIQYQPVGGGTWTNVTAATGLTLSGNWGLDGANIKASNAIRKTLRLGARWKVPSGQYNVMVTRGVQSFPGAAASNTAGGAVWAVLRSISPQNPSTTGTTKLALRIKATDQLNGVVSTLSLLAAQKVRQWDKTNQVFTTPTESQNPAWIYAWLLTQCPAVMRRIADNRLDWDGIADWAVECDAKGYKTSFVMDSARAFADVLRDVLASGRASFGFRNGLYSAVRDIEQTVPVQMFTPANSWGFSYSRAFADLPHALRCKFVNTEANYQQDYVTVYAVGYNADGSGGLTAATRFEELDLGPVVDPDAAWRLGMYHLSVIYNRLTQYVFNADIEHMVCERGDLISVAHDITGWGVAWGRIVAVDDTAKTVTLDGPVTLAAGTTYKIRARTVDSTVVTTDQNTASITSPAGEYTVLQLATALDAAVGDVWVLGDVNNEVASLIVRQIEPVADFNAKITCVDAAPAVWSADSGTPPAFVSNINGTAWCAPPDAPSIYITAGDSPPDDAGVIHARAFIGTGGPGFGGGGGGGGGGVGGGGIFRGVNMVDSLGNLINAVNQRDNKTQFVPGGIGV